MAKSNQSNFPSHHKSPLAENRSQQLPNDIYFPAPFSPGRFAGLPGTATCTVKFNKVNHGSATFYLSFGFYLGTKPVQYVTDLNHKTVTCLDRHEFPLRMAAKPRNSARLQLFLLIVA